MRRLTRLALRPVRAVSVPTRTAAVAALVAGGCLYVALSPMQESLSTYRAGQLVQVSQEPAERILREVQRVGPDRLDLLTRQGVEALLEPGTLFEISRGDSVVLASSRLADYGGVLIEDSGSPFIRLLVPKDGSADEPVLHWVISDDVEASLAETVVVQTYTPLSAYPDLGAPVEDSLWPVVPPVMLAVAVVVWAAAQLALQPVRRMRAEASRIGAAERGRRVPVPEGRHAVAELARTLNGMLDRLQEADDRQRRFVADAAHELRSPIASLRAVLDVAIAHPQRQDWEATARDVSAEAQRLEALAADLLLLARLEEHHSADTGVVDLGELVQEEAGSSRARRVQVVVRVRGHVLVDGSEPQLRRLVANLMDNAARHAASTVRVEVGVSAGTAQLEVGDDGPGIPHEHRRRVFERFVRLDDARDRDRGGSGLGLAIVLGIARAHHGTVRVEDRAPGAHLTVELPVAGGAEP